MVCDTCVSIISGKLAFRAGEAVALNALQCDLGDWGKCKGKDLLNVIDTYTIPNPDHKPKKIGEDWKIVKSKNGKHPEDGYPLGEFLCRTEEHVKIKVQELKEIGVTDIEVSNYGN